MRKKNSVKKKKKHCRLLLGYCPFSACTGSRYSNLYRNTEAGKAGLARGACHDTNFVSWLGAAFVSQYGCDTGWDMATVCHDTTLGAATCAAARDMACAHGLGAGCFTIQHATRPARLAIWPGSTTTRQGMACDTAPCAPRYSPTRATTRRCACNLSAVRAA